uniref:Sugar phosphate isomerase/epimerase n=1 Tax=Roseihalotalea indica TaxID=2867963 RepID=A0AA49GJA6_9BACT|nr:sugar phosphate isomerase/epimerase [Tunicatimonas sp. TK19036]
MSNLNRRIFFKHAGAFALGSLILPACSSPQSKEQTADSTQASSTSSSNGNVSPIGIQLYSVRDIIENDLQGTLQQLANMGYKEIEAYPGQQGGQYFGMEPEAFSSMLKDMGMTLVSSHVSSGSPNGSADSWRQATLLSKFDELLEQAAKTGQTYLTCSWMDESLRKTPDDLKSTADLFNQVGEKCKDAGLTFAYHNHWFEYEKVGDTMIYDFMLDNTDPELVQWELDMFWVVAGGQDPVAYLQKYPNRFPLGHVKDMDKQNHERNIELGKGAIDYSNILKVAKENGMKHFLIEQETYSNSSIESVKEDYQYLSELTV